MRSSSGRIILLNFRLSGFLCKNCDLNNEKPSNCEPISRGAFFAISSTDKKIDFTDEKYSDLIFSRCFINRKSSHYSEGLTKRNFLNKVGSSSNAYVPKNPPKAGFSLSTPERTRTPNLLVRSQTLYPIELQAHI